MHLRTLLFFAAIAIIQPAAHAQFARGDKMVGASLASAFINSGNSDVTFDGFDGYSSKTNGYGLRIEPTVGWFISNQTALGLSVNVNPAGQKWRFTDDGTTFQEDEISTFNFGIGIFARNYFNSKGSLQPFGQAGANAGISSQKTEGFRYYSSPDYLTRYDGKSSGGFFFNGSLQAGVTKMMGENSGLDVYIGYTYAYNKNTMRTESITDLDLDGNPDLTATNEPTTKFTNHNFIVGIGFQIFLRKRSAK